MVPDLVVVPVDVAHYLMGHVLLARCWRPAAQSESLEWFLQSLRGELPKEKLSKHERPNFMVKYISLPRELYLLALAALSDLTAKCKVKEGTTHA